MELINVTNVYKLESGDVVAIGMLGTNLALMVKGQLSSSANVLVVTTDVSKISGNGKNTTLKSTVSENQVRQIM